MLEALAEGGADVEARDVNDLTALHLCVREACADLQCLLRPPICAEPSSPSGEFSRTPLHWLCCGEPGDKESSQRVATILLDYGARPNANDRRGDTPLMLLLRGDRASPGGELLAFLAFRISHRAAADDV